jgi:hypothetical protein
MYTVIGKKVKYKIIPYRNASEEIREGIIECFDYFCHSEGYDFISGLLVRRTDIDYHSVDSIDNSQIIEYIDKL